MNLTEADFELLHRVSTAWGKHWEAQKQRFGGKIRYDLRWAYWFPDYASLVLGRTFLQNIGSEYQELHDEATGEHLIITNYASVSWQTDW